MSRDTYRYQTITLDDDFRTGKDITIEYEVLDSSGDPVDVSSFTMRWVLVPMSKVKPARSSGWEVSKTSGSGITVTGSYNSVRASNTQRVAVTVSDTDTDALAGSDRPDYYHELTRTDAGNETTLSYGPVVLQQSPTR